MAKLREKMEQALKSMPNFQNMKEHVEMTITVDGLRIELLETEAGMFFESGRPLPSQSGAELLTRLAGEDPEAAGVAKLRIFAGLSVEEAAEALSMSRASAYRQWAYARAWLHARLNPGSSPF